MAEGATMASSSNSDAHVEELLQKIAVLQKTVETLEADRKVREQLRIKEIEVQSASLAQDFKEIIQREEALTRREEALEETKASLEDDFKMLKEKEKEVGDTVAAGNLRQQQLCEQLKEFRTEREDFLKDRAAIVDHSKKMQEKLAEMVNLNDKLEAENKDLLAKFDDRQEVENAAFRVKMQEMQEKLTAENEELRKKMNDVQGRLEAEKEELRTKIKEAQDRLKEHQQAAELRAQFPVREFHAILRAVRSREQVKLTEPEQELVNEGSRWASSLKNRSAGTTNESQHAFARKLGAVVRDDINQLSEMRGRVVKAMESSQSQSIGIQHVLEKMADALLKFEGIRTTLALPESSSAEISELAFTVSRLCDLFKQPKCSKQIPGLSASNSSLLRASAAVCLAGSGACKHTRENLNARIQDVKTCRQKIQLLHSVLEKHSEKFNKLLRKDGETSSISEDLLQMLKMVVNGKDGGLLSRLTEIACKSTEAWQLLEEYQQCTRRFAKDLGSLGSAEDSSKAPSILFSWLLTDMKRALAPGSSADGPVSPWVEFAVLMKQAARVAGTKRSAASPAAGDNTPSKRRKAAPEHE